MFQRSIDLQIAMNKARTPTERLSALCDLLDVARAMAPMDAAAVDRRRRVWEARQKEREQLRARFREFLAVQRINASTGI